MRRDLHFSGIGLQVRLDNAPEVEAALAQVLNGWQPQPAPPHGPRPRQSHIRATAQGFSARSDYLDETLTGLGPAGATCAVIADLAQDYFESRPGWLALHCAAVQHAGRLIAMTGPARAGKSTLAARLTLEPDMQVFCDDVLPLGTDGQAVALGIAPRLRLPLPDGCSAAFRAHVARHMGPRDDRYGYLCAPGVAPHGTRAPLAVLLILDRRRDAAARLHAMPADEALHFLLSQNMSDLDTAEAGFHRLSGLLAGVTCLRLVYSDLEAAVTLIRHAFGGDATLAGDTPIGPPLDNPMQVALPQAALSPAARWARNPDVVVQPKAGGGFLWQAGRQMIWHLNSLGLAVWTLLEIPGSARDIGALLHEQFPDEDQARVIADINALIAALARDGLIVPAQSDQAPSDHAQSDHAQP